MGNEESTLAHQKVENDIKVQWKKSKSCPFQPREGQSCASIGNKLYIFGGVICTKEDEETLTNQESNQLLVFDIDDNTWEEIKTSGQIPEPRSGSTLAAVGKELFLFGGLSEFRGWLNDLYVFDTDNNTWSEVSNSNDTTPSPRDKLSCASIGKDIYYFGGFGPDPSGIVDMNEDIMEDDGDDDYIDEEIQEVQQAQNAANFTWFNDIFKFDTVSKEWSKVVPEKTGDGTESCPSPRAAHTMCAVEKGLIVFGGRDSIGRQNDIWTFSLATRQWEECHSLGYKPEPRSFHASAAIGKRMIVCGGRSITNEHFKDFHIFDTDTRQWFQPEVTGDDRPPGMGMHSLCFVKDMIVLYGGTSHLDPVTNSCTDYYSDCFTMSMDDVLTGGAVISKQEATDTVKTQEKNEDEIKGDRQASLPEFLKLKPT